MNIDYKNTDRILVIHEYTMKNDGDFVVAKYKILDPDTKKAVETVVAMGEDLPTGKLVYTFYGSFEFNKKYKNYSFKVNGFQVCVDDVSNLIDFLASPAIKGCGKVTAKKIVKAFGDKTLDVLKSDDAVLQLSSIKGINKKKAERIVTSFCENNNSKELLDLIKTFGFNMELSKKVFARFKGESMEVIKNSPYNLCKIEGIGFSTADDVAVHINYDLNKADRIHAAIEENLKRSLANGNCYMNLAQLLNATKSLCDRNPKRLKFEVNRIRNEVQNMVNDGILRVFNGDKVFLKSINDTESRTAKNILSVARDNPLNMKNEKIIKNAAEEAFKNLSMTPSDSQMDAVVTSMLNSLTVITGGPGVGKTTVIKAIIKTFKTVYGEDSEIVLAAPTGRASRRMTESCGYPSQTLHKLLKLRPVDVECESNNMNMAEDIEGDLLIVDEFSMVDIFLANHLFGAIGGDTKVVIVGDIDQLPSVGPGLVLKCLIEAKEVPTVRLKSVFRQSEDSSIHINAQKILQADTRLIEDNKNFFFIPTDSEEATVKKVLQSYKKLLSTHNNDLENVQVLTPRREKAATSSNELNKYLQDIANPSSRGKEELVRHNMIFRVGDKVMHVKTNTDTVSNGDIGYISAINTEEDEIRVNFSDHEEIYYADDIDNLVHSYATTIHKSQGSEYDVVIIPLFDSDGSCQKLLNRNLIYTAITRAKTMVVIIGRRTDLNSAIMTKNDIQRNNLLKERIFNNALRAKPVNKKFA